MYGFDKKKVEKEWNKLYGRYTAKPKKTKKNKKHENDRPPYNAAFINDFTFEAVAPTEEVVEEKPKLTKAEKKEAKQKQKAAKQQAKNAKKQAKIDKKIKKNKKYYANEPQPKEAR